MSTAFTTNSDGRTGVTYVGKNQNTVGRGVPKGTTSNMVHSQFGNTIQNFSGAQLSMMGKKKHNQSTVQTYKMFPVPQEYLVELEEGALAFGHKKEMVDVDYHMKNKKKGPKSTLSGLTFRKTSTGIKLIVGFHGANFLLRTMGYVKAETIIKQWDILGTVTSIDKVTIKKGRKKLQTVGIAVPGSTVDMRNILGSTVEQKSNIFLTLKLYKIKDIAANIDNNATFDLGISNYGDDDMCWQFAIEHTNQGITMPLDLGYVRRHKTIVYDEAGKEEEVETCSEEAGICYKLGYVAEASENQSEVDWKGYKRGRCGRITNLKFMRVHTEYKIKN